MKRLELLKSVRKVVVKIGTASLSTPDGGLDEGRVARFAEQINALKKRGLQVVVVSSGAISAGMNALGLKERPTQLPELQACAAVGQGRLTAVYDQCFRRHGYHAGQMLLTRDDFNDRRRYLNASNALYAIIELGGVPVINENDTISVDEITFGDNDGLAALVATMLGADLLVLLTTVEGLFENPDAPASQRKIIREVSAVNGDILGMATSSVSQGAKGGMTSKLQAAQTVTQAGIIAMIAPADKPKVLEDIFAGEETGTIFLPANTRRLGRHKRWLRFGSRPKGKLTVDSGAMRALVEGKKSLLPSGIVEIEGTFAQGDLVSVCCPEGNEIARGLVNYSSSEMMLIRGQKTSAVRRILGDCPYDEAIHRDHLALSIGD